MESDTFSRDTAQAMSQENVEIVRRLAESFNARDFDSYYIDFFDPEVEWRTPPEDPDAAIHRGRDAYRRYLEKWMESFDGLRADVEEYVAVDDERVFSWARWSGRGRASGAPADWHLAIIFTIRDGRVVLGQEFFDKARALETAGLSQ
jgi:ketosteroid isomerase-like protein